MNENQQRNMPGENNRWATAYDYARQKSFTQPAILMNPRCLSSDSESNSIQNASIPPPRSTRLTRIFDISLRPRLPMKVVRLSILRARMSDRYRGILLLWPDIRSTVRTAYGRDTVSWSWSCAAACRAWLPSQISTPASSGRPTWKRPSS